MNDNRYGKDAADQNFDYMFKLLIIGNSSVGKTSFLFRYADDSFTSAFVSTVGIDFKVKTIFRNDKRVKLQIWVRSCCIEKCSQNQLHRLSNLLPHHTNPETVVVVSFSIVNLARLIRVSWKYTRGIMKLFISAYPRTQRVKRGTEQSQLPITAEPWALSWCTTSPTKRATIAYKIGMSFATGCCLKCKMTTQGIFNYSPSSKDSLWR